jgi:hypothetical protein
MAARHVVASALLAGISILALVRPTEACSCIDVVRTEEQVTADFRAEYGRAVAVFVGRAIASDVYQATFEVEQVWKGDLGERVTLETGVKPADSNIFVLSSDDRHFAAGTTYLVFAYGTTARMCRATVILTPSRH